LADVAASATVCPYSLAFAPMPEAGAVAVPVAAPPVVLRPPPVLLPVSLTPPKSFSLPGLFCDMSFSPHKDD
jgi:hypothetical protein